MDVSLHNKISQLHKISSSGELFDRLANLLQGALNITDFRIYFRNDQTQVFNLFYSSFEISDVDGVSDLLQRSFFSGDSSKTFFLDAGHESNCYLQAAYQLEFQGTPFGCLTIHRAEKILVEDWQELFVLIGDSIGAEIIKMQLYENASSDSQLSLAKLQGIHDSLELIKNLDLDIILMKLMGLALKTMDAAVGSIMISEKGVLKTKTDMGFSHEIAEALESHDGVKYLDYAMQKGEAVVVLDALTSDLIDVSRLPVNLTSIITIPLGTEKDNFGLLHIINSRDSFDKNNFEVLQTICNLSSYALENALLHQAQLESTRLKEAMAIAQQIHLDLLPKEELTIGNIEICGWSKACDETGGDYYDLIEASETRLEVIVGDATGHGIGAAQTMLIARSALRTLFQLDLPLKRVFELLNNRIAQDTSDEKFMTLFCGSLNPKTNMLSYCSGGHDGPLILREGEEIIELEATGVPLGMMEDMEYEVVEDTQLKKGDLVLMGSDGVWEAMNENNEEYGKKRLIDLARNNRNKSANEINKLIQTDVINFMGEANARDDMTLIVLKVN